MCFSLVNKPYTEFGKVLHDSYVNSLPIFVLERNIEYLPEFVPDKIFAKVGQIIILSISAEENGLDFE